MKFFLYLFFILSLNTLLTAAHGPFTFNDMRQALDQPSLKMREAALRYIAAVKKKDKDNKEQKIIEQNRAEAFIDTLRSGKKFSHELVVQAFCYAAQNTQHPLLDLLLTHKTIKKILVKQYHSNPELVTAIRAADSQTIINIFSTEHAVADPIPPVVAQPIPTGSIPQAKNSPELKQEEKTSCHLPRDLWGHAFEFSSTSDIFRLVVRTCKTWRDLASVSITQFDAIGFSNSITDEEVKTLVTRYSKLTKINLFCCDQITDDSILHIAQRYPNLTKLNFYWCSNLTDTGIDALAQQCSKLIDISLCNCEKLTDEGIIALARGCPELEEIDLSGCKKLTDKGIIALAQCSKLRHIRLSRCTNLNDKSIIMLAEKCPNLEEIALGGCKNLTDKSIVALALGCPKLKKIDLGGCKNLTDESIIALAQGCQHITEIQLCGCEKITDESIKIIAQQCKKLFTIDLSRTQITNECVKTMLETCYYLNCITLSECPNISGKIRQYYSNAYIGKGGDLKELKETIAQLKAMPES